MNFPICYSCTGPCSWTARTLTVYYIPTLLGIWSLPVVIITTPLLLLLLLFIIVVTIDGQCVTYPIYLYCWLPTLPDITILALLPDLPQWFDVIQTLFWLPRLVYHPDPTPLLCRTLPHWYLLLIPHLLPLKDLETLPTVLSVLLLQPHLLPVPIDYWPDDSSLERTLLCQRTPLLVTLPSDLPLLNDLFIPFYLCWFPICFAVAVLVTRIYWLDTLLFPCCGQLWIGKPHCSWFPDLTSHVLCFLVLVGGGRVDDLDTIVDGPVVYYLREPLGCSDVIRCVVIVIPRLLFLPTI